MKTTKTVSEVKKSTKMWAERETTAAKQRTIVSLWLIDKFEELSKYCTAISPLFDNYIYYTHSNKVVLNHHDHEDEYITEVEFEKFINSISKKDLKKLPKGIIFQHITYTSKSF